MLRKHWTNSYRGLNALTQTWGQSHKIEAKIGVIGLTPAKSISLYGFSCIGGSKNEVTHIWAFPSLFLTLNTLVSQWNVTPLLGDFGGRVGIYRFLHSPPIPRRLPSLFKLQEILMMKNYVITLIRGNYATSGWQNAVSPGLINEWSLVKEGPKMFIHHCFKPKSVNLTVY